MLEGVPSGIVTGRHNWLLSGVWGAVRRNEIAGLWCVGSRWLEWHVLGGKDLSLGQYSEMTGRFGRMFFVGCSRSCQSCDNF